MKCQRTSPLVEGSLTAKNPKESISYSGLNSKRFPKNVLQMFIQAITGLSSLNVSKKLPIQILLLLAIGILTPCSPVFAANVSVSWDPNTESDIAGYKLYKRTLPSQDFGQPLFSGFPNNPSSPTTTVTGLSEGTTYGFIVTAIDTSGNESAPSIEKQFTTTTGTPPPPPPTPSSLTISNLTVASGKTYVVPTAGLQVGGKVYIDRSYTFRTVPASLQGAAYIQTANNDKAATQAAFLSFTVNQPVTVSVAHDVRITPKPAWLATFTDTGKDLVTSDTTLHLFAQSFAAGTITLGGNVNAGSGNSMYAVVVVPQGGSVPPTDSTPPSVPSDLQATPMSTTEIRLQWTPATDEGGVTRYTIVRNGTAVASMPTPSYTDQGLSPSTLYTYTVTAEDAAGNVSAPSAAESATTMPLPDTTPPSVALLSPQDKAALSGLITVSATATDNVGVAGVQFHLNGAELGPEDTTNTYAVSWDTTTVANGTYSLIATARDIANNTTTSLPVSVTVSNTTSLPLTISNLTVASGKTYVVPTAGLQVGGKVYIDRSYTFRTVPASLQGAAYIQTANNDKAATQATFLSFTVNQPVTVSVAHDVRITPKPAWLATFTDTGKDLVTSDTTLHLFAQSFAAGTITLGGNVNAGSGNSMYAVVIPTPGWECPPNGFHPAVGSLRPPGHPHVHHRNSSAVDSGHR